jgi:hypothetical protein
VSQRKDSRIFSQSSISSFSYNKNKSGDYLAGDVNKPRALANR